MKIKYKVINAIDAWIAIRHLKNVMGVTETLKKINIPNGFKLLLRGIIRKDDLWYESTYESWEIFGPIQTYHKVENCYLIIIRKEKDD